MHHMLGLEASESSDADILKVVKRKWENDVIKSHLRSAENSLEHLPQIMISVSLLIHSGHSRTLIGDNITFMVGSTLISALSLIRGQVSTTLSKKNSPFDLCDEQTFRCLWSGAQKTGPLESQANAFSWCTSLWERSAGW